MSDPNRRNTRLRYTMLGAVAALAAVGAIAGTVALAAKPDANTHGQAAVGGPKQAAPSASGPGKTPASQPGSSGPGKTPASQAGSSGPGKTPASQAGSSQPFLAAVQRLVNAGTITASQAQAIDREIQSGGLDTQTLASVGLTNGQLQALEQALANTKRALAAGG